MNNILMNTKNISETEVFFQQEKLDLKTANFPLTVTSISFRLCNLHSIPKDFFMRYEKLENIDLYANCLTDLDFLIPENVTNMDVSYNKINKISTTFPDKFEYINISYNFLTYIPDEFKNIRYSISNNSLDMKIIYKQMIGNNENEQIIMIDTNLFPGVTGNDIENIEKIGNNRKIGEMVEKVEVEVDYQRIGRNLHLQNYRQRNTYTTTNVHDVEISSNTRETIQYLLNSYEQYPPEKYYLEDIMKAYLKINNINFFTKYFSFKYYQMSNLLTKVNSIQDKIIYDYGNYKYCQIKDVLERVWAHAKNNKEMPSIIEHLFINLKEGDDVCFVGKYTRIINTLSSFISEVKYDLPVLSKISNKIIYLRAQGLLDLEIREPLVQYMNELNVSEAVEA